MNMRKNSIYPLGFLILLNLSLILSHQLFHCFCGIKAKFLQPPPIPTDEDPVELLPFIQLHFHIYSEFFWLTHLFLLYHCGFVLPLSSHVFMFILRTHRLHQFFLIPCPQIHLTLPVQKSAWKLVFPHLLFVRKLFLSMKLVNEKE